MPTNPPKLDLKAIKARQAKLTKYHNSTDLGGTTDDEMQTICECADDVAPLVEWANAAKRHLEVYLSCLDLPEISREEDRPEIEKLLAQLEESE